MDAIHGKVGLPNFVVSQPGHVRQHPDTIDRFAEKPCGGYLWTSRTDVSHEVSIDPVDDAGVHVCHLERYGYLMVLRYVSVDDLSHHQDQANDGQNKWNHFHLNHYMCLRGLGCEWIALAHATF